MPSRNCSEKSSETVCLSGSSATAESYAGLTFNPAGTWIYYTIFNSDGFGKLNRIPLLGGSTQEIAKDVDSPICFAPDGKKFAFIRSNPGEGVDRIIISNVDGSGERVLSEKKRPEFYRISTHESLAWSPDGKLIASPFGRIAADGEFMSVAEINVETGEQRSVTETKWRRVGRIQWTKNADELLITAAESGSELFQIRKIFRSSGLVQNVTGELSDYYSLSLNADSARLLSVAYDKTSNLYIASSEQPTNIKPLTGGNYDGIGGVLWTTGERIIYVSAQSGNRDIWARDADGGDTPQQMTFERAADDYPSISNDGKHVVFVSSRTGVPHVWRMNASGGEAKQLTDQGGESLPGITPDGDYVVYSRAKDRSVLWKISTAGGEPAQLTKEQTSGSAISPDGKFIACLTRGDSTE
jgi:Tol biopolymer transport system component